MLKVLFFFFFLFFPFFGFIYEGLCLGMILRKIIFIFGFTITNYMEIIVLNVQGKLNIPYVNHEFLGTPPVELLEP